MTLIVAGLGILGTLGGIAVGHLLAESRERKQWLIESRKQEFRELLTAIAKSLDAHVRIWQEGRPQSPEDQIELANAISETFRTFQNRIFITEDVDRLRLEGIWVEAAGQYKESFRPEIFSMLTAESALQ